jgi:hypothetical protein
MWEVPAMPRFCGLYPGIYLTTEEKVRKNLSLGSSTYITSRHTSCYSLHFYVLLVKLKKTTNWIFSLSDRLQCENRDCAFCTSAWHITTNCPGWYLMNNEATVSNVLFSPQKPAGEHAESLYVRGAVSMCCWKKVINCYIIGKMFINITRCSVIQEFLVSETMRPIILHSYLTTHRP